MSSLRKSSKSSNKTPTLFLFNLSIYKFDFSIINTRFLHIVFVGFSLLVGNGNLCFINDASWHIVSSHQIYRQIGMTIFISQLILAAFSQCGLNAQGRRSASDFSHSSQTTLVSIFFILQCYVDISIRFPVEQIILLYVWSVRRRYNGLFPSIYQVFKSHLATYDRFLFCLLLFCMLGSFSTSCGFFFLFCFK